MYLRASPSVWPSLGMTWPPIWSTKVLLLALILGSRAQEDAANYHYRYSVQDPAKALSYSAEEGLSQGTTR